MRHITLKADLSSVAAWRDFNRLQTKRLHPSQTEEEKDGYGYVYLDVCPNPELYSTLLQYQNIEVASPKDVRDAYIARLRTMCALYPEIG